MQIICETFFCFVEVFIVLKMSSNGLDLNANKRRKSVLKLVHTVKALVIIR